MKHPYQDLTPDVVLDALSALGLPVDGRMSALSSYENRVYQVMLDDAEPVVAAPGSLAVIRMLPRLTCATRCRVCASVCPQALMSRSLPRWRPMRFPSFGCP